MHLPQDTPFFQLSILGIHSPAGFPAPLFLPGITESQAWFWVNQGGGLLFFRQECYGMGAWSLASRRSPTPQTLLMPAWHPHHTSGGPFLSLPRTRVGDAADAAWHSVLTLGPVGLQGAIASGTDRLRLRVQFPSAKAWS